MPQEKDFNMYVEGPTTGWSPAMDTATDQGTASVTTDANAEATTAADANVDEIAKLAEETPAAAEVAPEWEVIPDGWEAPAGEEKPEDATQPDNVSWEELQKMLDSLNEGGDEAAETTQDIKAAAEEVKSAVSETDTAAQAKVDDLLAKIAEKEANEIKMQKTIDVLKNEYEKTLNDKISLEYGTASDSKIAQIVNEDPDVKNLITAKLATGEDAKQKLTQAWRTWRESVSGQNLDNIISTKKQAETEALASGEDASIAVSKGEGSMYL